MLFPIFLYRLAAGVAGARSNGIEMASQNSGNIYQKSSSRESSFDSAGEALNIEWMIARDTTRTAKVWHAAVIRYAQQKFGMICGRVS